ncbi:DNA repair protein RecO [Rhizosaccharibacter radicis]|uniref:DNA repair protein RecO n=1 Tax=Rhizosaccharibacter radicis TaxID=2782605 RepID=A0ABT1VYL1_9PROT|nr:DNA repair protein RecO [Acetobacteraceae bacterium KSS12]
MEWDAPALVLSAHAHGEGGAVAHVLTAEHGAFRGLVRGGAGRKDAATWQAGNMVSARWFARLPEQLGTLSAELVHPSAARIMAHRLPLALLSAACALADAALPEREPHPRVFDGLLALLTLLSVDPSEGARRGPAAFLRWEALVLSDLGYGLDLSGCAVTGQTTGLRWVSPRTGRAVSDEAAGPWRDRLLPLPPLFLDPSEDGTPSQWRDGLRLTGAFLQRDLFGQRHRPLPAARSRLHDLLDAAPAEGGSGTSA